MSLQSKYFAFQSIIIIFLTTLSSCASKDYIFVNDSVVSSNNNCHEYANFPSESEHNVVTGHFINRGEGVTFSVRMDDENALSSAAGEIEKLTFTVFKDIHAGEIIRLSDQGNVKLFYTLWPKYHIFKSIAFLSCSAEGQIKIIELSDTHIDIDMNAVIASTNVYKYSKNTRTATIKGTFRFKKCDFDQLTPWLGAATDDWNATLRK